MSKENEQCGGLCGSPALIAVALAAAFIVPLAGFGVAGLLGGKPAAEQGEEAVLRRIQPMAQVSLAAPAKVGAAAATPATAPAAPASAPASAPAPADAAPIAAAAPAAGNGKKVYDSACMACHASGVANAPKLGDKAAWAPRLKAGVDGLTASAIKGKGAMPPKGGNTSIPDADIRAAVEYMAAAAK